jgi:hypothetical protein
MVGSPRAAIVADDDEFFHTGSLIRLAGWGLAAAASVAAVVYIARTDLGTKRFATAIAAIGAPPSDPQQIATAQLSARIAHSEREARRAIETVQAISSDRERMQARIITLENEIGELTAAVHRVAASSEGKPPAETKVATPEAKNSFPSLSTSSAAPLIRPRNPVPGWTATPVQTQAAITPEPKPVSEPKATEPPPTQTAAAAVPLPRSSPVPLTPSADAAKTTAPAEETTGSIASAEAPAKVEFGADLGPALTMGRLRARWTKLAAEHPDLVKGLRPLVSVRDTGAGKPVEVRLLVGPMANVNGATGFCQALASPQYLCRPAVFDGQRLTVQ